MSPNSERYLQVINNRSVEVTFILELWGETYPMPPGAEFDITLTGNPSTLLQIRVDDQQIKFFAPQGNTARVFYDGRELGRSELRPPY